MIFVDRLRENEDQEDQSQYNTLVTIMNLVIVSILLVTLPTINAIPSLLLSNIPSTNLNHQQLQTENAKLRLLNAHLRQLINRRVASTSLLEINEEPSSSEDTAEAEISANKQATDQSVNNFCLAPAECQERLFSCRRHAIEKCWQTDYAKGGAPPGSGDLDQDRLQAINDRVKQKLLEIGIDLDCDPSASGVKESSTLGKGGGAEGAKKQLTQDDATRKKDATKPRFAASGIQVTQDDLDMNGLREGLVDLD